MSPADAKGRQPTAGGYTINVVEESPAEEADVARILRDTATDVVVNYLPVGSQKATEFYAQACLDAGVSLVNADGDAVPDLLDVCPFDADPAVVKRVVLPLTNDSTSDAQPFTYRVRYERGDPQPPANDLQGALDEIAAAHTLFIEHVNAGLVPHRPQDLLEIPYGRV